MKEWLKKILEEAEEENQAIWRHLRAHQESIARSATQPPASPSLAPPPPLPAAMEDRIRACREVLGEFDPTPLDKVLDDFRRDSDPERGLLFWEAVSGALADFTKARHPTPVERRAAFDLLSHLLIMGKDPRRLSRFVRYLSEDDVRFLVRRFGAYPVPVG